MKKINEVAVVVPVYNEKERVVDTIKKILINFVGPIIIIDDGSNDGSYTELRRLYLKNSRIILSRHVINLGKGAAMKTGVEIAWKIGCERVIFVDADGQHNPIYIKKFIKELEKYPIVFGYRRFNKKMPFIRKYGNIFALKLVDVVFNIKRKDLLCGFLGFSKSIYKNIEWGSCRYGIETEMATKVGKNKIPFSEVKVDTIYIDKYKGVSIIDAVKVLMQIPFWYFSK